MGYLYLGLSALAAAHAYFFAYWLMRNGNRIGAVSVFALALMCLALPVYRMMQGP